MSVFNNNDIKSNASNFQEFQIYSQREQETFCTSNSLPILPINAKHTDASGKHMNKG